MKDGKQRWMCNALGHILLYCGYSLGPARAAAEEQAKKNPGVTFAVSRVLFQCQFKDGAIVWSKA